MEPLICQFLAVGHRCWEHLRRGAAARAAMGPGTKMGGRCWGHRLVPRPKKHTIIPTIINNRGFSWIFNWKHIKTLLLGGTFRSVPWKFPQKDETRTRIFRKRSMATCRQVTWTDWIQQHSIFFHESFSMFLSCSLIFNLEASAGIPMQVVSGQSTSSSTFTSGLAVRARTWHTGQWARSWFFGV